MARALTPIKAAKPAPKGRKQGGSPAAATTAAKAKSPGGGPKSAAAAPRKAAAPTVSAGQVSKGDLRAQIEKLEQANAKLRAKAREAGRDAKVAATRIAELEKQVAQLEKRLTPKAEAAESPATPSKAKASRPRSPKAVAGGAPTGAGNGEDTSNRDTAGEAGAAS